MPLVVSENSMCPLRSEFSDLTRSLDLAPEHGHLVAKGQQVGLLGAIGADEENDELDETVDGEVSEGPELAAYSLPTHRRGKVAEEDLGREAATQRRDRIFGQYGPTRSSTARSGLSLT